MNQFFLIATLTCVGLLVVCMAVNIVRAVQKKEHSKWMSRLMHLFGMLATVFNTIRIIPLYDDNRGTMIAANVIVFLSLIVSLVRSERPPVEEKDSDEDSEDQQ